MTREEFEALYRDNENWRLATDPSKDGYTVHFTFKGTTATFYVSGREILVNADDGVKNLMIQRAGDAIKAARAE